MAVHFFTYVILRACVMIVLVGIKYTVVFILYADVWSHGYGCDIRVFGCFPTIEEAIAFVLANDTISIGCNNNFRREEEFFSFSSAFAERYDETESFEDYLKHYHIRQIVNGTATCIGGYVE